jgi:hypothetical protein
MSQRLSIRLHDLIVRGVRLHFKMNPEIKSDNLAISKWIKLEIKMHVYMHY